MQRKRSNRLREAMVLTRIISPGDPSLGQRVVEAILVIGFAAADEQRTELLAEKAREGTLSSKERVSADSCERVGHFVSLLKSKARRSIAWA